jgi:hypothetical protein
MVMQPKVWIMTILFDKWISHFTTYVQARKDNFFTINCHFLIFYLRISQLSWTLKPYTQGKGDWGWTWLLYNPTQAMHETIWCCVLQTIQNHLRTYKEVWTLVNKSKMVENKDLAQWVCLIFKRLSFQWTFAKASRELTFGN